MTKDLNNRYFEWMFSLVRGRRTYIHLMRHLHKRNFVYDIPMDENRYADGVDLRYRFGYECNIDDRIIASVIDVRPCSILELMAALALRCEENIMDDPRYGSRIGVWFWEMIKSLGLDRMDNRNYDEREVDSIIDHFLDRDYDPNGRGGLFTVYDSDEDFRDMEIWQQMSRYLNSLEG